MITLMPTSSTKDVYTHSSRTPVGHMHYIPSLLKHYNIFVRKQTKFKCKWDARVYRARKDFRWKNKLDCDWNWGKHTRKTLHEKVGSISIVHVHFTLLFSITTFTRKSGCLDDLRYFSCWTLYKCRHKRWQISIQGSQVWMQYCEKESTLHVSLGACHTVSCNILTGCGFENDNSIKTHTHFTHTWEMEVICELWRAADAEMSSSPLYTGSDDLSPPSTPKQTHDFSPTWDPRPLSLCLCVQMCHHWTVTHRHWLSPVWCTGLGIGAWH